jgi:hypothetical protein
MATLPILGSFLFSACGDGGGARLNQSVITIGIQDYEFVYPKSGATNVCTYPTFQIKMKNNEACTLKDLSSAVVLFDTSLGADKPLAVNAAAPYQESGGCVYKFTPKAALGATKRYGIGVYESPGSSAKTVLPNTAEFTTGAANAVDCGDGSRFIVERVFGASAPQQTDIDNLGTFDANGDFHFDAGDLLKTGIRGITSSVVGGILGNNTLQNAKQPIYVKFNEVPNPMTLIGIAVFQVDLSLTDMRLTQPVTGISVVPSSQDPYTVEVKAPSYEYPPNQSYTLYIGPVLSQTGKALSSQGANSPRAYVSFFRVGNQ